MKNSSAAQSAGAARPGEVICRDLSSSASAAGAEKSAISTIVCPFCSNVDFFGKISTRFFWSAQVPDGEIVGDVDVVWKIRDDGVLMLVLRPNGDDVMQAFHRCEGIRRG